MVCRGRIFRAHSQAQVEDLPYLPCSSISLLESDRSIWNKRPKGCWKRSYVFISFWKDLVYSWSSLPLFSAQNWRWMDLSLVLETVMCGKVSLPHPFFCSHSTSGHAADKRHENSCVLLAVQLSGLGEKTHKIKNSHRCFPSAGGPHRGMVLDLEPTGGRCQWQKWGWFFWCTR